MGKRRWVKDWPNLYNVCAYKILASFALQPELLLDLAM